MRQLITLLIVVALLAVAWGLLRMNAVSRSQTEASRKILFLTDNLNRLSQEQEDKLVFYLTKQMGTYEGSFQIIDVVNLQTRDVGGTEYLLVTLRAPNGKFCQVIVSRKNLPWAQWQVKEESFMFVDIPQAEYVTTDEQDLIWMKELGITPEDVHRYLAAHPEKSVGEAEMLFTDQSTGMYAVPKDFWKIKTPQAAYKLEIGKDKTMRFVSEMRRESSDLFWKVDYPADYLGAGYRGYLFEKVKGD